MQPDITTPAMTFAEKMFARACGLASAAAGDIVYPDSSLVIIHDSYLEAAYKELTALGYRRIVNPERLVAVTDHEVLYTTPRAVARGIANRRIMREWQGGRFFDAGQGGHGHVFPMEMGLVQPGMFLAAYDSHCSNFGAIGAYAMAAVTDVTVILATGTKWTVVPETVRVDVTGDLPAGVHPRDVCFQLSSDLVSERHGFDGEAAVIEFRGESVERMPVAGRIGLINTLTEIAVAHVLFPPKHYDNRPAPELQHLMSDPDARLRGRITLDLSTARPTLALPGAPSNAAEISAANGRKIDHAYIGACGSSQYEDFAGAASVMKGRAVASGVRMFVVPGTVAMAARMMKDGLAQTFMEAGAIMLPAGCGPCAGGVMAPVGPGEVSISTAATNTKGRMGSAEAEYFLASPLTVAAAAVTGRITDPREMLA